MNWRNRATSRTGEGLSDDRIILHRSSSSFFASGSWASTIITDKLEHFNRRLPYSLRRFLLWQPTILRCHGSYALSICHRLQNTCMFGCVACLCVMCIFGTFVSIVDSCFCFCYHNEGNDGAHDPRSMEMWWSDLDFAHGHGKELQSAVSWEKRAVCPHRPTETRRMICKKL